MAEQQVAPRRSLAGRLGRSAQWPALGGLVAATLVLGYLGFSRYFTALGQDLSVQDLLYRTLQLFTLESGAVPGPLPWQLEAARFLAMAVAAWAAVKALTVIFRDQWRELRLRRWRQHVVICGLGRKAALLARSLRARGDRVVLIEKDSENDFIEPLRSEGALVLVGDARSPRMLRRARLARAAYLVALSGDDGVNAEIAVAAARLVGEKRKSALPCLAHIFDPRLCQLLRLREIERSGPKALRLEFLNVFEAGARTLLRDHPPRFEDPQRGRIVVAGLGHFGESVALQAAADWRADQDRESRKLTITILDRAATARAESLALRHPQLRETCNLEPVETDLESPELHQAAFLEAPAGVPDVAAVYVCVDDESVALSTGLTLQQQLEDQSVPVVVRTLHEAGLALLLEDAPKGDRALSNLHAFGLLDRTCTPGLLSFELLARRIHQRYLERMRELGVTSEEKPAAVPWEELDERYRESNREQADHIGEKLEAVGCGLAPLQSWSAEGFEFSPREVEQLAELEHRRWLDEKRRQGWKREARNEKAKTHPDIRPYEELEEEVKDQDRDIVRQLPSLLAAAGCRIVRR